MGDLPYISSEQGWAYNTSWAYNAKYHVLYLYKTFELKREWAYNISWAYNTYYTVHVANYPETQCNIWTTMLIDVLVRTCSSARIDCITGGVSNGQPPPSAVAIKLRYRETEVLSTQNFSFM